MSVNKQGLGRYIPEATKRIIREKCSFGCVVCGTIPYDYDHLREEFNAADDHDPDDIVLLCDRHHRLKTAKILSVERIVEAKQRREAAVSDTRFKLDLIRPDFETIWGSNIITATDNSVVVDGEHVLTFKSSDNDLEPLLLSGQFCDKHGNLLCRILDNEFIGQTDHIGDFTLISNRFTYTMPDGSTALAFKLSDAQMTVTSAFHVKRDAYVVVNDGQLRVGNLFNSIVLSNSAFTNCETAISVGTTCANFSFKDADLSKINGGRFDDYRVDGGRCGVMINGRPHFRITSSYDRI